MPFTPFLVGESVEYDGRDVTAGLADARCGPSGGRRNGGEVFLGSGRAVNARADKRPAASCT